MPSSAAVSSAVCLTTRPMRPTASMLMPARVVATLTEEQTAFVEAKASGMESISSSSPRVMPLWTRAEKPPMKLTPQALAAWSMAWAKGT